MRVAVTRPRERALETAALIRERGWEPLIVPSIEIVPRPIDPELRLEDFDWLVVTSASGAEVLWDHYKSELTDIDIAVVGPKTKGAFLKMGLLPRLVATEHVGEGLAADLRDHVAGKRVLVARAAIARKGLVEELQKIADVMEIALYDTRMPADHREMVLFSELVGQGEIDAVVFTSSRAARNLIEFLEPENKKRLNGIKICAIGPITARTVEKLGVRVSCTPDEYTLEDALDAIEEETH